MASGEHTKASALATVTAQGLRSRKGAVLTQETVRKVLVNRLYAGELAIKGWGEPVRGDFAPLVSQETFDRVQGVLEGRAPAFVPHVRERADFSLRGLIRRSECGQPVTGSTSTGRAGGKFRYYRCHHVKGHFNVRAEVVESEFVDMLNRLTPKPERMALIERIFRASSTERIQDAALESAALKRELAKENARKQRVLDQMADGVLSPEYFSSTNKSATEKIADLRMRLALSESDELDLETAIEYLTHILWKPSTIWQTSDLRGKQKLQCRLFPERLIFEKTGLGTPVTHSIYTLLVSDSVDAAELVAPQGLRSAANKRVGHVFHNDTHINTRR